MNRVSANRLEGTLLLKWFCASILRVHVNLNSTEKVNCDNC